MPTRPSTHADDRGTKQADYDYRFDGDSALALPVDLVCIIAGESAMQSAIDVLLEARTHELPSFFRLSGEGATLILNRRQN